jgi:nucleoside-diphosphate-sugar epimerase
MKKIMIVGGAGYIGGYLADYLNATNNSVLVYDNLVYENRYLKNVPFKHGDVRDSDSLKAAISEWQPDTIVWLAALVGDGACQVNPELTSEVNYESVKWICDNYDGKIVFTSTCSVYGMNDDLITEEAKTNPLSVYASTKLMAEQYLIENKEDCLVFRLGTLFGLGDRHSRLRLDLVANILTLKAVRGESLSVFGGEQWRPLLHVKDVARAITHGISKDISGLYNLHHKNFTIKELAEKIMQEVDKDGIINYEEMPFEDLRNYRVSSESYRSTGWYPRFNLESGIKELAAILSEGRIKDTSDSVYSNERFLKELSNV